MKSNSLKPHQTAILVAGLASLAITAIPGVQWALLPLTYLNTHIHEASHALSAVGTGGSVDSIHVYANGSGLTWTRGGTEIVLNSAGYLGASLIGMLMVMGSRTEGAAATVLRVMAGVLGAVSLLWLRGDGVGIGSAIFWILALLGIAHFTKGMTRLFLAQFIGVQQCLNSVTSILTLLELSVSTDVHSDAQNMQRAFGLPAMFWAVLWCLISLTLLTLGLRKAWSTTPTPVRTSRAG